MLPSQEGQRLLCMDDGESQVPDQMVQNMLSSQRRGNVPGMLSKTADNNCYWVTCPACRHKRKEEHHGLEQPSRSMRQTAAHVTR
jgi:hypothetical protein